MEFVDEVGFDGLEQFLSLGHFIPGVMQAYQHTLNLTGSIFRSTHYIESQRTHTTLERSIEYKIWKYGNIE